MMDSRLHVDLGCKFRIHLESNPSTGYSWDATYDKGYIELEDEDYQRTSYAIGGGGVMEFTFIALKKGRTALIMRLKRPWEEEEIKILNFDIVIV
jgi:inhibitor of cysteine peptidase